MPEKKRYIIGLRGKTIVPKEMEIMLDKNPVEVIKTGDWVKVDADNGTVEITKKQE